MFNSADSTSKISIFTATILIQATAMILLLSLQSEVHAVA